MWATKKKYTVDGIVYEDYHTPESWWCPKRGDCKLNELINCASCGDLILYAPDGHCFASTMIMYANGNGYTVCRKCRIAEEKAWYDWIKQCEEAWSKEQREAERKAK